MDYFLFLLISIFSIIFYIFINYSLSILGYRTFGLNNEESESSNQTDEKPLEQSSNRLSYEAYILAIFIRNLIICIGLSSFILFLNQTGLFDDLMNTNLISLSILYFLILVLSIVITNKIFSILNNLISFVFIPRLRAGG